MDIELSDDLWNRVVRWTRHANEGLEPSREQCEVMALALIQTRLSDLEALVEDVDTWVEGSQSP